MRNAMPKFQSCRRGYNRKNIHTYNSLPYLGNTKNKNKKNRGDGHTTEHGPTLKHFCFCFCSD